MQPSWVEKGWMLDESDGFIGSGKLSEEFIGIRLGSGGCAEHEQGVRPLMDALGVPKPEFPVGIKDRQMTIYPERLRFHEYTHMSRDKRRKKGIPAALLMYVPQDWTNYDPEQLRALLNNFGLNFSTDIHDKWHSESSDSLCSWGAGEFGIHVRGAENVKYLKLLHGAFLANDIALGQPTRQGFLSTGLSFVVVSRVPPEVHVAVEARDLAHQRLTEAARASGIEQALKAAGKHWYALSPDWYDRKQEKGLIFFLNPADQLRCNSGWFSLEQLQQWAQGTGPVLKDLRLEAFEKANLGWKNVLVRRFAEAQLSLRTHPFLAWADEAQTQVGVYLRPAVGHEHRLAEGVYAFDDLLSKYPEPVADAMDAA